MAAKTLGLPKAYVSYEEILSDPDVKVVHIATPNRQHRDMVIGALDAGKHVVCEKPLATSSLETSELVERATAETRRWSLPSITMSDFILWRSMPGICCKEARLVAC